MTYVEQTYDPADESRHGLTFTTSMPGETRLARCRARQQNGDECGEPLVAKYEDLPDIWSGRLKLCAYHQQVEDDMLRSAA